MALPTYNRESILSSIISLVQDSMPSIFQIASYKTIQTDFLQENAYPVIYVIGGSEDIHRKDLVNNYESNMDVLIRIVVKNKEKSTDDALSPLITAIVGRFTENTTVGSVQDAYITDIKTDEGILYPYSLAELTLSVTYRFTEGEVTPVSYP